MLPRTSRRGPGAAWTPPTYRVDDSLKVIGGYFPQGVNNWGRWGADDQIGTLNYIGPEQAAHAASLVRTGERFSLALPIAPEAPRHPTRAPASTTSRPPAPTRSSTRRSGSPTSVTPTTASTWRPTERRTSSRSPTSSSTTRCTTASGPAPPPRRVPRCWASATSAPASSAVACCSTSLAISVSSGSTRFWRSAPTCWTRCARSRGSSCAAGDIVLIRTGALGRWWSLESDAQRLDWFSGSPGPGIACLEWFHRNEIAAGAADGSYAFLLVAQPLNLPRALGSPLNPIAIK